MRLLTFLLLLMSSAAFSQAFTYNQGGPAEKNYYAEIPFENINGKLFLEGEIAGKKRRFLFDTGAPVAISQDLATELKAKVLSRQALTDAYLHVDSNTIVEVNGIKLGDITFNQIPALSESQEYYKCYGIDGVIGSNLLRNSIVSIDNKRHLIIFTDQKDKLNLNEKNSAPLKFKESLQSDPQISLVLNANVNLNIPFDTGDDAFLRIDDNSITALGKYARFDVLAKGYGASKLSAGGLQNAADKYLYRMPPFVVGDGQFYNLTIESDKETLPAIGSKLLNYGVVTLDFINSKFYFDAYKPLNELSEKQWPIEPTFTDNKFIIGVVWEKAKDLFKQGDQIIAVNGKDYSHVTMCDLIDTKTQLKSKDQVTLTVKNAQGETRKVKIMKE